VGKEQPFGERRENKSLLGEKGLEKIYRGELGTVGVGHPRQKTKSGINGVPT